MSKRVSELYGMDIYTQKGQNVGRVEDVILNLERGEVMRLSLKPLKGGVLKPEDVRSILKAETINYDDVVNVGDIILIQKTPTAQGKAAK